MITFFRHKATPANNRISFTVSLFMLLMTSSAAFADDGPVIPPFEAEYTAYKWGGDVGNVSIKLEYLKDEQYALTYHSDVSKFFLSDERFEHSVFFASEQFIHPFSYYYKRTGTGPDKELEVKFASYPEKQIEIKGGETLPWNGETDNQLYRIDLARKLAAGETEVSYDFVNYRGELKNYDIKVTGNENLDLPYGKLETIKVKLLRDHSSSRETFAWFAPSLNYNLVRLQQFKDGDEQGDIRLKSYRHL